MLLIVLVLIYVGILFKRLAEKHKKNPVAFAVVGIVAFILGLFALSFLLGIVLALLGYQVQPINRFLLEIVGYAMGGVVVWISHRYLDTKWEKSKTETDFEIIDDTWEED